MKRTWLFSLLLVLALALSACAGGSNDTDATDIAGDGVGTETASGDSGLATEPAIDQETAEPVATATPMVEPTMGGVVDATPDGQGTGVPETGGIVNDDFLLCTVMDYDVQDPSGEDLGDVNDFVLDASGSRIQYVVVGAGGFLGIGEQDLLVPFDQFTIGMEDGDATEDDRVLVYNGDVNRLENAPMFDLNGVDFNLDGWDADFVAYWSGDAVPNTVGTPAVDSTVVPQATMAPKATVVPSTGETMVTKDATFVLASDLCGAWVVDETTFGSVGAGNVNGTLVAPNNVNATPDVMGTPGASDMTNGTTVADSDMGATFDQIGEVDNVVMDPQTGNVTYLVIDPDDDVVADDVWMPVALSAVRIVNNVDTAEAHDILVLVDSTRLSEAPSVEADNLPDLSVTGWDADYVSFWGMTR